VKSFLESVRKTVMHEMAVADSVAKIVQDKMKESGEKGTIRRINLKVGKLTCVEPEALRLSFKVLSKHTPLENASLVIDSIAITAVCRDCKKKLLLKEMDFTCPHCGSFRMEIKTGRELLVESFEID